RRQAVRCEVDRIDARREFLRLKVLGLYTDVFKIHLLPGEGLIANAVHLQPDESGGVERIDYIGHGRTVYPGFGFIADGFDTYVVKGSFFISRFGLLVKVEWIEPSTAGLVVNPPCPCTFAGVDFYLPAIHAAPAFVGCRIQVTTRLDARIGRFALLLDIYFEDEVTIFLFCDEEGIGRARGHGAHDGTIFDGVGCLTTHHFPPI